MQSAECKVTVSASALISSRDRASRQYHDLKPVVARAARLVIIADQDQRAAHDRYDELRDQANALLTQMSELEKAYRDLLGQDMPAA